MASGDTPALATNPKIILFTDFDGTITTDDCNEYLVDNLGFGPQRRRQLSEQVLNGQIRFCDSFLEQFDSITAPYNECLEILRKNIKLDPGFNEFYKWSKENNVPIVILSSGAHPMIRTLLDTLLGPGWDIQIVSNDVVPRNGKTINEEGGWRISFHDDSHFGHDKSLELRKYSHLRDRPIILYAGDGVSDLSAAKEADLLFAKAGKDLVSWCERERVPFVTFRDWTNILQACKDINAGLVTPQEMSKGRA